MRTVLLLTAFAIALGFATPANAELIDDVDRVVRLWSSDESQVARLPPIFLEHGRVKALVVEPITPAPSDASLAEQVEGCTSVALLGARSAEFSVATEDELIDAGDAATDAAGSPIGGRADDRRERSTAGAVLLVRCGKARKDLTRLSVEMQSARGALEVVIARSHGPLRDLREMLPERVSGPIAPRGDPGRPIEPGPLPERIAHAERRARQDGAEKITTVTMLASGGGHGEFVLKLGMGCHRLEVMAEVPATFPHRVTDVDAELRELESERMIARDRADTPDALFDACFGEPTVVSIKFGGASGAVNVTTSDAVWPIPASVPSHWGARARAGLASALLRRRVADPRSEPVQESLGVAGITSVPVELIPGTCYLASVALIRGDVRGMRLTAHVGDRTSRDEVVEHVDSASVAFCADAEGAATIDVETHGSAPWWVLSVWAIGPSVP